MVILLVLVLSLVFFSCFPLGYEIESFLGTLEETSCDGETYYYDRQNDFTIIEAAVIPHFFYQTITYEVRHGDYCANQSLGELSSLLGGIKRYHTLNGDLAMADDVSPYLVVAFLDDGDGEEYVMKAELHAYYVDPTKGGERKELERSKGTFEVKDEYLSYTRLEILEKANDLTIPEVSSFAIEDGVLTLVDNYFSDYEEEIVLK